MMNYDRIKQNNDRLCKKFGKELFLDGGQPNPNGKVNIRFMGVNNFHITDGETTIMIDPYFTRPDLKLEEAVKALATGNLDGMEPEKYEKDKEIVQNTMGYYGIDKADVVVYAHSHIDHTLDMGAVHRVLKEKMDKYPDIIGSRTTMNIGAGDRLPEDIFKIVKYENVPKSFDYGEFTLTLYKGTHLTFNPKQSYVLEEVTEPLVQPCMAREFLEGGIYSIKIEHPGTEVMLFQSSFGATYGELAGVKADIIFMGVGGVHFPLITMGEELGKKYWDEYYKSVLVETGAKKVYMTHWDDCDKQLWEVENFMFGAPAEAMLELPNYYKAKNKELFQQ